MEAERIKALAARRIQIGSPGTAKNVITVGAIEQFRSITNDTWICRDVDTGTNIMNICFTNKTVGLD